MLGGKPQCRADPQAQRSTGGDTGYELELLHDETALLQQVVEAHRGVAQAYAGNVTVTSKVGVGSTFTVHLPMSRQAPPLGVGTGTKG